MPDMKAHPDCIVCMFRQALNTVRLVSDDTETHRRVLAALAARVAAGASLDQTPAALSQPAYDIIAELTGIRDPYAREKRESNTTALRLLPDVRARIDAAADPLAAALHAAVAGNVIDLGIGHAFDIERDILAMMDQPFAISALDAFRRELQPGRKLLYLGDNAGEIVFDRLLVEQLLGAGVAVTFTVKSAPIINDATREDADQAGLTGRVPVIETGSGDIGVNWARCSAGFREAVAGADVILAKGHGNFETCNDRSGNFFFLLKAKCPLVARTLGCELGDLVFKRSSADRGLPTPAAA
ncbi:MAG: DUF89 family protein [Lentisphaerae bacterium]|nr:DUF89 family protein [Lentisphaerota bacterium]